LSDILWEQAKTYTGKLIFVEGNDKASRQPDGSALPNGGRYHTRVTKETLQPLLEKASMVVCRSGYSTLMDLAVLHKKAILIPTPGQTEQELLAKHLHKEGVFYAARQKDFNLQQALADAQLFPFKQLELDGAHNHYERLLDKWLSSI
jgi:UDP-N-acetylglucosamine:LPS N-acetylglucosamine transferase